MKKNKLFVFFVLAIFCMASCATTHIKENPAEADDSPELAREDEEVKSLVEAVSESPHDQPGKKKAAVRLIPSAPDSDAYQIIYHEFGPEKVPFIVSLPNNTNQEINAIIWFCDEAIAESSNVFDLGTYPSEYKEKYIIAVLPYKFESGDVRVKNIKNSVGSVVNFVKVIAEDHEITLNRIILVGYTIGQFSMAYL